MPLTLILWSEGIRATTRLNSASSRAAFAAASRALIVGLLPSSSVRVSPDSRVVKRSLSVSLSSLIGYAASILGSWKSGVLVIERKYYKFC
jgi:hypothetical protein